MPGVDISPITELQDSAGWADIISCATLSETTLIKSDWLNAGVHLDLVGAFRPDMRESDDATMARARIFVDTRAGALTEAGDIVLAIRAGAISEEAIVADLCALASDAAAGRGSGDEITVFKSVGAALEDLAAARLIYKRFNAS